MVAGCGLLKSEAPPHPRSRDAPAPLVITIGVSPGHKGSASRCNCCLSGNYINQKPLRHRAAALLNGVSVRARSSGRDFRHLSRGGHLLGSWSTCPSRNSGPVVRFRGNRKREGAGGDPILATKRLGGGNSREDSATTPIDSGARFRREILPDSGVLTDGGGSSGPA